jgi:hypothetical protein
MARITVTIPDGALDDVARALDAAGLVPPPEVPDPAAPARQRSPAEAIALALRGVVRRSLVDRDAAARRAKARVEAESAVDAMLR